MYSSQHPIFSLFSRLVHVWYIVVLVCYGMAGSVVWAEPTIVKDLTPQQRNGKNIFLRGESISGRPVYATLGDPPMQVSAKMLPCVNCHGYDGHGLSEGGVQASDITWSSLTKSYGAIHATGRRRSAYTEATVQQAITEGFDPSSNKLGVGMPKFQMDEADMKSLIAYIKCIETDVDPGITDTELIVATILPTHNSTPMAVKNVVDILTARFEMVNKKGGVYGRKIKLRVLETANQSVMSVARLRHVLTTESIFAVIAPFTPDASVELAKLAKELEIPIIVPLAGTPHDVDESNRFVFYLHSSLDMQARVMVDDLSKEDRQVEKFTYAVLSQRGESFELLAGVVKQRMEKHGYKCETIVVDDDTPRLSDRLTKLFNNTDGVFLFGLDVQVSAWLTHATRIGASPKFFMLSASFGLKTLALLPSYDGQLIVAFPNSNRAQSPRARAAFQTFLNRHGLPDSPDASSVTAYCAASLFIEGIEKSGRLLRRERLIRELEGLYEFSTGLTRDVSFGPTTRVGVRGAYLVTFKPDPQITLPDSHWVEFEN